MKQVGDKERNKLLNTVIASLERMKTDFNSTKELMEKSTLFSDGLPFLILACEHNVKVVDLYIRQYRNMLV